MKKFQTILALICISSVNSPEIDQMKQTKKSLCLAAYIAKIGFIFSSFPFDEFIICLTMPNDKAYLQHIPCAISNIYSTNQVF